MNKTPHGHNIVSADHVLQRAREYAAMHREAGNEPVFWIDVDGVMFNNQHRTLAILREFIETPNNALSWFWRAVEDMAVDDIGYGVKETVEALFDKYAHESAFMALEVKSALVKQIEAFWFDRFFTNEYQAHDVPIPGALEFVIELRRAGLHISYLTGRDEPGMKLGFISSLTAHGFPLPGEDGVSAIMKPVFTMPDVEFKRNTLKRVKDTNQRSVGMIDDNTHNVNGVHDLCDLALLYRNSSVSTTDNLRQEAHVIETYIATS